jgi:hypothetical protein
MPPQKVLPQLSFGLSAGCKKWFFDKPGVQRMMLNTTREALSRAGALVRMIARRSMKYVTSLRQQARLIDAGKRSRMTPVAPSAPGTPPHAVRPHPWIREFLYYAYDPGRGSVVIGPMRLNSRTNVPALHEAGGTVTIRTRHRMVRRVGGSGELRVGGRPCRTTKMTDRPGRAAVAVTYGRMRTPAQAARANYLNEELYGAMYRVATYLPRPFMGPALQVASPSLPKLWATSIKVA